MATQPQLPAVGTVLSVSLSGEHTFSKPPVNSITLLTNLGVEGDAHCGETEQHLSRKHSSPSAPNLRQVHLIASEILDQLRTPSGPEGIGFDVKPGDLGENITTAGVDLLGLGKGAKLHFLGVGEAGNGQDMEDAHAVVTVTGLRKPCRKIEAFQEGLQEKVLGTNVTNGPFEGKVGIFGVVTVGGVVAAGAKIVVELLEMHEALVCL